VRLEISLTAGGPAGPVGAGGAGGPDARRLVEVDLEAPVGTALHRVHDDLVALLDRPVPPGAGWWVDGAPVSPRALLGSPPLVRGAVLEARAAGPDGGAPVAQPVAVTVACGPGAGAVQRLPLGEHVVGRAPGSGVVLPDPDVSRAHALLEVRAGGLRVRDLGSTNGTRLAGRPVGAAWCEVPAGAPLEVGRSLLRCGPAPAGPAPARGRGDGLVEVHRSPGEHVEPAPLAVDLPAPPHPPVPARVSVLAVVLPVALSVVMAVVWSPLALLFGLASPVLAVGTALGERRAQRRQHAAALAAHEESCRALREAAGAAVVADRAALEALGPEVGVLVTAAQRRGAPLWARTRPDLLLRLGRGRVDSSVVVREPGAPGLPAVRSPEPHEHAPVLVPLRRLGGLGITGRREVREGLARSLVVQAVVLHRPADLRVVVLEDPRTALPRGDRWRWVGWLPHGADDRGEPVGARAAALHAELLRRESARSTAGGRPDPAAPEDRVLLVVLDGAGELRRLPGVAEVLARGPAVGIVAVCLEDHPDRLPVECAAVARLSGASGGDLHLTGTAPAPAEPPDRWAPRPAGGPVAADLVPPHVAEEVARALAPLVEATPALGASALPRQVRLLDVLDVDVTDPGAVAARWRRSPRSTRVALGRTAGGAWVVDLAADGPHALVAGTTGSGKSELLTTLVLSLAAGNRPEELALVLVDYKGGAAFAGLADLPHVVGLVTDLDDHLTRRALASLQAEVRRRERVLRDLGCRDHAEHVARRERAPAGAPLEPLPRLVVVVDEFRVLAEELPDLLGGLVRLAAVGRSLGVHLVLATQRPAGVVSAEIRANTALRIALRVHDEADSLDVVDAREAARLPASLPGRAVTRSGSGPLVPVQAARASGTSPATAAGDGVVVRRRAHRAAAADPSGGGAPTGGGGPDDLARAVAALRRAAEGAAAPQSPWLPPLPDTVDLEHLAAACGSAGPVAAAPPTGAAPVLAVGMRDEPRHQRRSPLVWDLAGGPLLVVGGPRTGRTSTLRAVLGAVARRSPAEVQAHVVAAPSPLLAGAEGLPQVGSVVDPADAERLLRLLHRLTALVRARRGGAAGPTGATGTGAGDGGAQLRAPTVLLLVDGADRLLAQAAASPSAPGDDVGELLTALLADGPAVGVLVALAGGRSLLLGRCGALVRQRLLHALSDPADAVLAGVPARQVPSRMPPGRVLVLGEEGGPGHEVVEAQVAVLGSVPGPVAGPADARAPVAAGPGRLEGPDGRGGAGGPEELAALAAWAEERWRDVGVRPWPVPSLPQRVELADLLPRAPLPAPRPEQRTPGRSPAAVLSPPGPSAAGATGRGAELVVGAVVDGDVVRPAVLDPAVSTSWLVAGPPGSGRSTALVTAGRAARGQGAAVLAVVAAGSPLAAWARAHDLPRPDGRDEAAVAAGLAALEGSRGPAQPPPVVLVDDVDRLAGTGTEEVLLRLLLAPAAGADHAGLQHPGPPAAVVVAAGTTAELLAAYRGLAAQLRRSRSGLVLHPSGPGDGELLGTALPRSPPGPVGRATLVTGGRARVVQLAAPWSPRSDEATPGHGPPVQVAVQR
jgi:S-DNA-T family DNA segregation ATPase FtsK/SpoIIIE